MRTNNSILKNIIYKFSLEILRIFIPIISVPYIYRIFKPEIMGQIEFSQSISGYFFIFAGFGVYTYGLREVSRIRNDEKKRNKLFTELFLISAGSSILVIIIYLSYILLKFHDSNMLKNMLLINSIHLIAYIFYIEWINEAFENYKFISQKTIIIKVINVICIFLFIKIADDFYKYLFLINIFIFINNFISFIYIRKYIKFDFKNLKIKKYIFPLGIMLLISNINILYTQLDRISLGFYVKDMSEVAYYSVSQKVMSIMVVIIMSIITVSMPRLSFYLGERNQREYEKLLNNLFKYSYLLLFPIAVGIIILSREISLFFGGSLYLPAQAVVSIFGIRVIVIVVESLLSNQVIFLHQKEKMIALIYGICGFSNLILKILLIKFNYFNASTAIFTTMLCEILIIFLDLLYIKNHLKINLKIFNFNSLKYFLFSLSFFGIKYILRNIELHYIFYSILIFICCSLTYLILLILSKDECLKEIVNKLNLKKHFTGEKK